MRKKQLGFTLVEILAVIVILGILSGVAIGGYSTYIKKAKKNYYIAQEKLLTQSGRDFYNDNKGKQVLQFQMPEYPSQAGSISSPPAEFQDRRSAHFARSYLLLFWKILLQFHLYVPLETS